jgi:hypothetical protein
LFLQARDNVKFLTTLERHFRSISSGPLTGILDTLPLLMNALRMIWIISRYYSDDAHMGGLFARIGSELCDRVNSAIMLHTLFRMPADEAIELLRVSKAVLECWQSTYMQVRKAAASFNIKEYDDDAVADTCTDLGHFRYCLTAVRRTSDATLTILLRCTKLRTVPS